MGQSCPDRSSESLKKGALLVSEEAQKCEIVAPGHNLPAKLRLGKLRRIKNPEARLELDRGDFRLHKSCQSFRIRCGNRPLFNLDSDPFWLVDNTPDWECFCIERYQTHDPEALIATLNECGWSNFQEVRSKNLKGLILYFESAKKYFWLQSRFDFWRSNVCSEGTSQLTDQTPQEFSRHQN
jgi:hypothetical protein